MARLLELRRHSLTKKGPDRGKGSQLSPEGVALAAREGAGCPRFAAVFASTVARTSETAIAMGFAVTDILPELGALDEVFAEVGFHAQWSWTEPFVEFRKWLTAGGPASRFGQAATQAIHRALAGVPDGASALFVTHGTALELALLSALPDLDGRGLGAPFSHCEGARLVLEDGRFRLDTILRVRAVGGDGTPG